MDSRDFKLSHSLVDALAQLDIGGGQDFINSLPNEILRSILHRIQAQRLIRLRSVAKRWKVQIEDICQGKKCLMIMHRMDEVFYLSNLSKRFNGHLKLNTEFVFFQLEYSVCNRSGNAEIHISGQLCTLLANLFPRIEQFYVIKHFSCSSLEFNSMLQQWSPTLATLSFCGFPSENVNEICVQINELANLKQLNLDSLSEEMAQQLAPTLARLEHLSGRDCDSVSKIVPYLESRSFSSLGLLYSDVTTEVTTKWFQINEQSVSSLVRLSFTKKDPQVLWFICNHFTSLQMLRIDLAETMAHSARLTHLTELRIEFIEIDLIFFDVAFLRVPLNNIRIFSLVDFCSAAGQDAYPMIDYPEISDVHHFARVLSAIIPNVQKLTVEFDCFYCGSNSLSKFGNLLEPHLDLFTNLRSFNSYLNGSITRLMD